jgi:DNA mismatch repair protein MutH
MALSIIKSPLETFVLNNYIFGKPKNEKIINDSYELIDNSFESYILKKVQPYLGRTQLSLLKEFQLKPNVKNVNELILSRILGLNGKISKSEEFQKANIIPKTVRINVNGSITESMSFPAFDFKKLASEDWDTSEFKTMLEQTKFLFVIFRFQKDGSLVFDDLVFWNIPDEDIDEVQNVWKRTVKILNEGVELNTVNGRTFNNLPKASYVFFYFFYPVVSIGY